MFNGNKGVLDLESQKKLSILWCAQLNEYVEIYIYCAINVSDVLLF